jgi:UDP-glucuronate decarboxylase
MNSILVDIIEEDVARILSKVDLSSLSGKKVLITGASGLIGTYLAACLKNIPAQTMVSMQSEPPTYYDDLISPDTEFYYGDLTLGDEDGPFLPQADYIIHAAGYGQPQKYTANMDKSILINTSVTMELLNGHLISGGKFLYLSSSEVHRDVEPYHPRACYINSKKCGETICSIHGAKVARVCLAYGPGTRPGDQRVLNSFIQEALVTRRIELLDLGLAKRTYCYVSDIVEMLWHILFEGEQPIYEVGGISRTTILGLAQMVGQYTSASVFSIDGSGISGASPCDEPNICHTIAEFGKRDFVSLEDGLFRTIKWQKELYTKEAK